MPRALTDNERDHIRQRLMEEAENCLRQYGVRKTTVDELTKKARIPKGTFYLFYESKELLFYDVLLKFHESIQQELLHKLGELSGCITPDAMTDLLFTFYQRVESSFLYPLLTGGEIELLMQKLSPELIAAHAQTDDFQVEQLIHLVPGIDAKRVPHFSAALRAVFLSMLHKREVGEPVFPAALYILIRGVVLQLFERDGSKV